MKQFEGQMSIFDFLPLDKPIPKVKPKPKLELRCWKCQQVVNGIYTMWAQISDYEDLELEKYLEKDGSEVMICKPCGDKNMDELFKYDGHFRCGNGECGVDNLYNIDEHFDYMTYRPMDGKIYYSPDKSFKVKYCEKCYKEIQEKAIEYK